MPFSNKAFGEAVRACGERLAQTGDPFVAGAFVKTGPNPIFSGVAAAAAMVGKVRTGYVVLTERRVAFYPGSMLNNAPADAPWFVDERRDVTVQDVVPAGLWGRFRYVSPQVQMTFNFHKNQADDAQKVIALLGGG